MGRRKIAIERVQDDHQREMMFRRRIKGIVKKSHELSVLCSANITLLVHSENNDMFMFSSTDPPDSVIRTYQDMNYSAIHHMNGENPGSYLLSTGIDGSMQAGKYAASSGASSPDLTYSTHDRYQYILPKRMIQETYSNSNLFTELSKEPRLSSSQSLNLPLMGSGELQTNYLDDLNVLYLDQIIHPFDLESGEK